MYHTKLLNLELDYDLREAEKEGLKSSSFITRNIINIAFQTNYEQGMSDKVSRLWRIIRKVLDDAVDVTECGYALFSASDFENVEQEVYKCKFSPAMARFVPYLLDELDFVKRRSDADEVKLQNDMDELRKAAEKLAQESSVGTKDRQLKAAV